MEWSMAEGRRFGKKVMGAGAQPVRRHWRDCGILLRTKRMSDRYSKNGIALIIWKAGRARKLTQKRKTLTEH